MNDSPIEQQLRTKLAIEIGIVHEQSGRGFDYTINAVNTILALFDTYAARRADEARLDEWKRMADLYPTAPYIPDFIT